MIINLCEEKIHFHDYILVSVIAPFEENREYARKIMGDNYIEIFVKASIKNLVKRDTKGLYKKAIKGELENLIGFDPNTPLISDNYNSLLTTIRNWRDHRKKFSFKKLVNRIVKPFKRKLI